MPTRTWTVKRKLVYDGFPRYRPDGRIIGDFLPTDLPGLVAWYDASRITGLSDGAAVSQWDDSSGNGYHVTQGTAGQRPIYKVSIVNGQPVVRFDGVDDSLVNTPSFFDFANAYTVFNVALYRQASDSNGLFAVSNTTVNTGFSMLTFAGTEYWRTIDGSGAGRDVTRAEVLSFQIRTGILYGVALGTPEVEYFANGASVGTNANYDTDNIVVLNTLRVGGDEAFFHDGDIAELFFYSRALSSAERSQVHSYLSSKYAITLS